MSFKAVPVVFPVRYTLSDGELKFAVPEEQLAKALDKAVATLQADGFDEDSGRRWTAFAAGPTERLETIGSLGLGPSSLESDRSYRGMGRRLSPATGDPLGKVD